MKRSSIVLLFGLAIAEAACGGGGSGGGYGGGGLPPAPPTISYANTSLPFYLPLATGNTWLFASGGSINDSGSATLSCACAYNGGAIESLDLFTPTSTYSGTLYFAKGTPFGQSDTFLVGVSQDHGTTITLVGSSTQGTQVVPGIGVMDDAPQVNELWSEGGGTSVIQSVGGTQPYGSEQIKNIAVDAITGISNGVIQTLTWGFAQGVGFTSIDLNGQSTTLTSFSVSMTSHSVDRRVLPTNAIRAKTFDISVILHDILQMRSY